MSEKEQKVIIGVAEFNALTNYLMERPYKEVSPILDELRQAASIIEVPTESPEESAVEPASDE